MHNSFLSLLRTRRRRARSCTTIFAGLLVTLTLLLSQQAEAAPSIFPTGVTIYDPGRAYNMYVLFDGRDGKSYLIDMNGNEVKTWDRIGFPSEMLDPIVSGGERGHIFVQLSGTGGHGPSIFNNAEVAELNWDGDLIWRWGEQAPGGAANQNHDQHRLPNGNTLLIATLRHPVKGFRSPMVADQCIYEVSREGKIVWRWVASEHLNEFGFTAEALNLIRSGFSITTARAGFLTINNMKVLGPNRWYNSGDARFHPDNLMIDSREGNFIAIIEKRTGIIVWRLGPDYPDQRQSPTKRAFNTQLPRAVDQISGQHDAHLIPEGLPGAGNLLVFDNQGSAGFPPAYLSAFAGSRVLEMDPIRKEIVWQYTGEDSDRPLWSFSSTFISSARRLPNGNTLICEGMNGRIFQVTRNGEIVWEYVSPYFGRVTLGGRAVLTNWVYRAQPVPYDWAPPGSARSEKAVIPPNPSSFRLPQEK
jgi:hypothetical protein